MSQSVDRTIAFIALWPFRLGVAYGVMVGLVDIAIAQALALADQTYPSLAWFGGMVGLAVYVGWRLRRYGAGRYWVCGVPLGLFAVLFGIMIHILIFGIPEITNVEGDI